MADAPWLTIVGIGEDAPDGLSRASRAALQAAEVIMGAPRHLALIPDNGARRIPWPVPFADGLAILDTLRGQAVAVLASGDPFWFGAGSVLAQRYAAREWRALPALSSFTLAAAELGWPLEQTTCLGLHAAPLSRLAAHLAPGARLIVLLRDGDALGALADLLCARGFGATSVTVLEALGGPRQRVTRFTAQAGVSGRCAHPLCAALHVCAHGDGARAGDRAGAQTEDRAGTQAGDRAGAQAGDRAGAQAGAQAGDRAGAQAEDRAGAQAEDRAGAQAGSEAGGDGSGAARAEAGPALHCASGQPDALFDSDGQLTKRPLRALTLSALAPQPGELLWDIGGGSGSIAIEWLLSAASTQAVSIEARRERARRIGANARRLGAARLQVVHGRAPRALAGLPEPQAVFIGGGLSDALLEAVLAMLPRGARLVANAVTLDSEALLSRWQSARGGDLLRIELARCAPIGTRRGWHAAYPVVQWSVSL